jgi:arylformamidase
MTSLPSLLISAADLDAAVPRETKRLLIRTKNSQADPEHLFQDDYVALATDAADWIVENEILCVGIDALSIERAERESHGVHGRLLGARVAVIEGLRLADVPSNSYELLCLPLALVGSDGAPARAVLRTP